MIPAIPASFWWGAAILSVLISVSSLILLPWAVTRLPADYFVALPSVGAERAVRPEGWMAAVWHWAKRPLKNVLGWFFVVLGLVMCFTPGQGILTMLIGVALVDVPGKHAVQRHLVRQGPVARSLNWIRTKAGHAPFQFPGK